jgi:hypothetical protein
MPHRRRFRTEVLSINGHNHDWLKRLSQSGVALRFPPQSKSTLSCSPNARMDHRYSHLDCAGKAQRRRRFLTEVVSTTGHNHGLLKRLS